MDFLRKLYANKKPIQEMDYDPEDMPDISVEEHPFNRYNKRGSKEFFAVDLDSYDGAPDGNNMVGHGSSPKEAVMDLCDQLLDVKMYSEEGCKKAVKKLGL